MALLNLLLLVIMFSIKDENTSADDIKGHWSSDGFKFLTDRMFDHRFSSPFWGRNKKEDNTTAKQNEATK